MKTVYCVLLFILVGTCSLAQSKDELLTTGTWMLDRRILNSISSDKVFREYYTQVNSPLSFKFSIDSTLLIDCSVLNGPITVNWFIKELEQEYLFIEVLELDEMNDEFIITKLDQQELVLTNINYLTNSVIILLFRHPDDPEWPIDEVINMMNLSK